MGRLPADVLDIITEELGKQGSLKALTNCALANKTLAGSAVMYLYRYYNQTSVLEENEAETKVTWEEGKASAEAHSTRWALMWRSIIRSSLGSTVYPYCLYIRSLDLENFKLLLGDIPFQNAVQESFFAGEMSQFFLAQETPNKKRTRSGKTPQRRFDIEKIIKLVGESITSFVSRSADFNKSTVALEDLSGSIDQISLPLWVSRLSRLKSMTLNDGGPLNESLAKAINNNCPNFNELAFWDGGTDKNFANFFGGLKANMIRSFNAFHAQYIGPETLLSLNNHSGSLRSLKLDGLVTDAIKNLSLLRGCIAIETLELRSNDSRISLEETENDVFEDVVAWLINCVHLRAILLQSFFSGPGILTRLCSSENTSLLRLEVRGYILRTAASFHEAISQQTTLESLTLRADNEGSSRDDIDSLLLSISKLSNLKELDLSETSEEVFTNADIKLIASTLPELEELFVSGSDINDQIWPSIAGLRNLRTLNILAQSSFTANGLLNYIWQLKPTNRGLSLWIGSQIYEYDLDEDQKSLIRESISERVSGKFDFILYRENDFEYDTFSD